LGGGGSAGGREGDEGKTVAALVRLVTIGRTMGMMLFAALFRDLALRETRSLRLYQPIELDGRIVLPADEYGFLELYCTERGCDCQRVVINVHARDANARVATINHAFDPPGAGKVIKEQTFLDPLNKQSPWARALLELFVNKVLADPNYCQRLRNHYRLFKSVVEDPAHPDHRLLRDPFEPVAPTSPGQRSIPPPPPRGRRRWR
jgi:hypothetical protein